MLTLLTFLFCSLLLPSEIKILVSALKFPYGFKIMNTQQYITLVLFCVSWKKLNIIFCCYLVMHFHKRKDTLLFSHLFSFFTCFYIQHGVHEPIIIFYRASYYLRITKWKHLDTFQNKGYKIGTKKDHLNPHNISFYIICHEINWRYTHDVALMLN